MKGRPLKYIRIYSVGSFDMLSTKKDEKCFQGNQGNAPLCSDSAVLEPRVLHFCLAHTDAPTTGAEGIIS